MDFKLYRKSMVLEKDIEDQILNYLSFIGAAFKINQGGKPIFVDGQLKMAPFNSRFNPTGISDIMFISKGKTYFFEVKRPEEKRHIMKFYHFYATSDPKKLSKPKKVVAQQTQFIERMRKEGLVAGFVCSLEEVIALLEKPSVA